MRTLFSGLLVVLTLAGFAQSPKTKDTTIQNYFNRLPSMVSSIEEAYAVYFPKNKVTPCKQYKTILQADIDKLADAANHNSRLLSMISGRYDRESITVDFSKVSTSKDPKLQQAVNEMNASFFRISDDLSRTFSGDTSLKHLVGLDIARKQLEMYRKELPTYIEKVKNILLQLDKLMNEKGYNKVLAEKNTTHPYYIQILEARGVVLDKITMLVNQIDAAQFSAASYVDICKRFPDSCK
jgi:hypothetical protein